MSGFNTLLAFAALLLAIPAGMLLVQVLSALVVPGRKSHLAARRPCVGVLVPAHNESSVIADTLRSLVAQMEPGDRLVVVADNCTDDTARVAISCGAEVVVRADLERRGKGYALDFGVRALSGEPPEILIVVDADCIVAPGSIDRLARCCLVSGRPAQALDLMLALDQAEPPTRIAEFAWQLKNHIRPLGSMKLGMPCQLMGTGMAFPWGLAVGMPLANGSIAEDLQLGVELTLAGHAPVFCPEASVISYFPTDRRARETQRERWEHGHLSVVSGMMPRLLGNAFLHRRPAALGLALDLVVPPVALLVMAASAMTLLGVGGWCFGVTGVTALVCLLPALLVGAAIALAWAGWGRESLPAKTLFAVPAYLLGKLPMYVRFFGARQRSWVKTSRD